MRAIYTFFFCLLSIVAVAQQKQGANWFFGVGNVLNFAGQQPKLDQSFNNSIYGASTISDDKGDLLFFTQERIPYTRSYAMYGTPPVKRYHHMPCYQNNTFPGVMIYMYMLDMIVQSPADPHIYYVFFLDGHWNTDSANFYQAQIDMRRNNGFGDAVPNSVKLVRRSVAVKMAALLHSNNRDTWILTQDKAGTNFYAYLLTPSGLSAPVITPTGRPLRGKGRLKSAPNSEMFATNGAAGMDVFDFNRSTGVPSFRQTLTIPALRPADYAYSTAFSPDCSKLYVGTGIDSFVLYSNLNRYKGYLYQFNLAAGNAAAVQNSRTHIATFDTTSYVSDIQLAIDGKLYIINGLYTGGVGGSKYLSRINCPDQPGTACRFRHNEVDLQGRYSGANLPSLNQTIFRNAGILQAQAVTDTICLGDSVQLSAYGAGAERFRWQAANGLASPSDTLSNPFVKPTATTTYLVVGSSVCRRDTAYVRVVVLPKPPAVSVNGPASVCPQVQGVWYRAANAQRQRLAWGVKGGTILTNAGDSISVNWGNANAAAGVWVVPKNYLGCHGDTVYLPVRVNVVLATQTPVGPDTLCQASASGIRYAIAPATGSFYTWGIQGGVITAGQGTAAVRVNWTQMGSGKLWVQEESRTSTSHCFGVSDTLQVKVLLSPGMLSISGPQQVCAFSSGHTYSLTGTQAGSSVNWSVTGGQVSSGQGTSTITVNWQAGGSGRVEAREVTPQGCSGPVAAYAVQVEALPVPAVTAATDLAICPSGLARPHAYAVQAVGGAAYKWLVKGGSILSGQHSNAVQVQWQAVGPETKIGIVQTSALGCASDTLWLPLRQDVTFPELKAVSVAEENESRLRLSYSAGSSANYPQASFQVQQQVRGGFKASGSVAVNAATGTVPGLGQEGGALVRLAGENLCGDSLFSLPHRSLFLRGEKSGEHVSLRWNGYEGWGEGVKGYEAWRQADGKANELVRMLGPQQRSFEGLVAAAGFRQCFKVRAVAADGRESWSNSVCVSFENLPEFCNIITPNGDGRNDAFVIGKLNLYPEHELAIFNRWGKQVYASRSYQNNWKAEGQTSGIYYYYFKAGGRSWKGWVEVVR
ncbi:T9SS type B sorting domain-containing protein [Adhaeribacter soli]|uniref:Gliding motility-associated C-terminal domain-containing protein n=1 Tax=Adhaeribacter soli TaxID=2607655 RepID=A0A5N1J3U5_9BACT|nr:gliding motility-associated C-terminal domain-containing protein [Adhaeribacter soli]KAA9340765.1 gliding motility-associated C-terminal domain-containing protein [Adhaeribacter soli]